MSHSTDPGRHDRSSGAAVEKTEQGGQLTTLDPTTGSDILPYVAPMFAYVGLTALEGYVPQLLGNTSPALYPMTYAVKLVLVVLLAWYYRATWRDFRPLPRAATIILAVLTGLVVCALWVGLDGHYPTFTYLGSRSAFDPFALGAPARWAFICVRLLGLVVVVPVVEELFWRSFLLRWTIDNEFLRVPIGKVTPMAAAVTSAFFALAHPEWLPALLTGALWAWLLWLTRSLSACLLSHATANLALGVYVIVTHDWKFW
jgi:CAAX prenyl protease-like protein